MSKTVTYAIIAAWLGLVLLYVYHFADFETFLILVVVFAVFGTWLAFRAYRGVPSRAFSDFSRAEKIRLGIVGLPAILFWGAVRLVPELKTPLFEFLSAILLLAAIFYLRPLWRKPTDARPPQERTGN